MESQPHLTSPILSNISDNIMVPFGDDHWFDENFFSDQKESHRPISPPPSPGSHECPPRLDQDSDEPPRKRTRRSCKEPEPDYSEMIREQVSKGGTQRTAQACDRCRVSLLLKRSAFFSNKANHGNSMLCRSASFAAMQELAAA